MESNHHQIFRENGENSGKLYVLSTLAKLILYFIIYLDSIVVSADESKIKNVWEE